MTTLELNSYMYERHATLLNGGLRKKNLCHQGHSRHWPKGAHCHGFATIHIIMHSQSHAVQKPLERNLFANVRTKIS